MTSNKLFTIEFIKNEIKKSIIQKIDRNKLEINRDYNSALFTKFDCLRWIYIIHDIFRQIKRLIIKINFYRFMSLKQSF